MAARRAFPLSVNIACGQPAVDPDPICTGWLYLSIAPGGIVTLQGANTYTGPTTVFPGTLIVKKAAWLYNADTAKWTPANITVHRAATLRLSVGGPGEFTGAQISVLLANLTTSVNDNGLMGGSVLSLENRRAGRRTAGGVFMRRKNPQLAAVWACSDLIIAAQKLSHIPAPPTNS